jgi:hypothetical protein
LEIRQIEESEINSFIDFQYKLYQNDENFRPKLRKTLLQFFTTNPFLQVADVSLYLAYDNDTPVGRIAKVDQGSKPIVFGFFECVNDYRVAKALFDHIDENKGLVGPINFTTNDSCGLLIEGFQYPPCYNMPYNKPYYQEFFERYGLRKKMDLFAYYVETKRVPKDFLNKYRSLEQNLKKQGIYFRNVDFNNFHEDVRKIVKVYNEANQDNWGFRPITVEEGEFLAKRLKRATKPEFVFLAEKEDEIVGYLVTAPDLNEIIFKNGDITFWTKLKFLFHKIHKAKISIIGVNKKYRQMGITGIFIKKLTELGFSKRIAGAEASYILENNKEMNLILHKVNAVLEKKYRIYEK